ncbi:MAG TPA: histidine--tRNA ligase [Clostridia bacterium]|jgi:histidyl-tRNA synthetase|nr:histidine--tRNA ligase [Clostridia bacterium]HPY44316.1 histidine--tRNA ligase [Clostridia bacterium]HQA97408.1 histidine--tRNA ligase [Clostridia bacterium]HQO56440.1 histidine--tRNA ligase [Clostridia bacterium]HUM61589.1 histidine--tRNA ligase [Clostridia bacterium]
MQIQSPKGTRDMLPKESYLWQWIESVMREEAALAGYREIRTPVFEYTELFERGVGDTTDIVQKEMYTFQDKGERSITLKPEGTAGAVRALIEHKLYAEPLPVKMYYLNNPIFRYENPQHGRLREHHQFGMECFGVKGPTADAEVILCVLRILERLGLENLQVHINSIGCPVCRPAYHAALRDYLGARLADLCPQCQERFERNPLRVLDCKERGCQVVAAGAPSILTHLCEECDTHFQGLQALLNARGLCIKTDPHIVRGLDYYTKTVFEIIMQSPRGPIALCGGGRYDGLVREIGGPDMPGVGFGIGTERILLELGNQGITPEAPNVSDVFVASLGEEGRLPAFELGMSLRREGFSADFDHMERSLKAQFRYADKQGVRVMVIVGGEELSRGMVIIKNMDSGEEIEAPLGQAANGIKQQLTK